MPVALLGLRNEENLFIVGDGSWNACYIPAFIRRYPFVFAETGEKSQRVACINASFSGFSCGDGEALFENGEATQILTQAIDFLEEYQKQHISTEKFVKRLCGNDLLMPLLANIERADGKKPLFIGLLAVNEKALAFYRSDELAWLYGHLISVGTMNQLITRFSNANSISKVEEPKTENKPAADEK